ncbi:putative F-box protein PP2-B12 isoform X1 [Eucalyptus grandis]|uniref:putative F-box protein PP2-B12 isoform X1 n=1 Tax=Eucalyptus grandis TaxID=71139 RepID=UPI00192E7C1C|nr:putative F-box protein PP2-B12 isoform X1 [Eucalyptus grandis]
MVVDSSRLKAEQGKEERGGKTFQLLGDFFFCTIISIETRTSSDRTDRALNAIDRSSRRKRWWSWTRCPRNASPTYSPLTTPLDAARSAAVSRAFRSASDSDAVWHKFLPPDLDLIVSTFLPPPPFGPSLDRKKDVFLRLCKDPLLIDSGRKSFALEKWSGKKCYIIGARDLSIVWDDTSSFWRWSSLHGSRFPEVAELVSARWLEVHAKMEMRLLSADTYYAAYFIFKFVHGNYGFENQAVEVSIFCGSAGQQRNIYFDPDGRLRQRYQTPHKKSRHVFRNASVARVIRAREKKAPQDRGDGWQEINLGEFFVENPPTGEVQISLMEVKRAKWKSGLVIQGIELRPTQMTSQKRTSQKSSRQHIGRRRCGEWGYCECYR